MWLKIKAFCLHSATMALTYFMAVIGLFFQVVDATGSIYNSDDFRAWVSSAVGGDMVLVGRVMLVTSALVALARLRGIMGWGSRKPDDEDKH